MRFWICTTACSLFLILEFYQASLNPRRVSNARETKDEEEDLRTEATRLHRELKKDIENAQRDCTRRIRTCSPGSGCGFGCQMHRVAKCMHEAYLDGEVSVVGGNFHRYNVEGCSNWTCVFKPLSECSGNKNAGRRSSTLPRRRIRVPTSLMNNRNYATAWIRGHFLAYAMSSFSEEVNREFKCLFPDNITAGIHIRRGDKLIREAREFAVRDYMHHVDHFVHPARIYHNHYDKSYNSTLFVATDDPGVLTELSHNDYKPYTLLTTHHEGVNYGDSRHLLNLLCELRCLVSSRYFVGTFSSQISRLVFELRLGNGMYDGRSFNVASMDDDYYAS